MPSGFCCFAHCGSSGLITFVLSSILIFLGASLFSCNVSSEPYLLQVWPKFCLVSNICSCCHYTGALMMPERSAFSFVRKRFLLTSRNFNNCFKSSVGLHSLQDLTGSLISWCSWCIDTDKDAEGLRVLVDLHGGDPENLTAIAEFKEIKERVLEEVQYAFQLLEFVLTVPSVPPVWRGHTLKCGRSTSDGSCLPWVLKHSLNLYVLFRLCCFDWHRSFAEWDQWYTSDSSSCYLSNFHHAVISYYAREYQSFW